MKPKIIYRKDCPVGKRYQMQSAYWKINGKTVLPKEIIDKHKFIEVRHPNDKSLEQSEQKKEG